MKLSKGIPGWIDFSPAMQRLTRNAIAVLAVPGAIDELGLGVFRDSISNLLFPGTTVTMTRAVYLAFLPACMYETETKLYKERMKDGTSPTADWYHAKMRQLQNSFCKKNGETTGIIGRDNYKRIRNDGDDADAYIVRYPFFIYWNALCRWDLIPGGKDENGNVMSMAAYIQRSCDLIHEGNNPETRWDDFVCKERKAAMNCCRFVGMEQEFIQKRMIDALPDTLLGPMVKNGFDANCSLAKSLKDGSVIGIPLDKISEKIRMGVEDMGFFTVFMQTAFAAYNALLNWDAHKEEFRESLRVFREKYTRQDAEDRLNSMEERVGAKPGNDTAIFLEEWMKKCFQTPDNAVPDLNWIAQREVDKKPGGRAKILKAWGGNPQNFEFINMIRWESQNSDFPALKPEKDWIGMDVLDYRWKETSRLVNDLLTNTYSGDASNDGK